MSIKQFNGSYLVHEDRILFRFNTQNQEEYRFWFTRRTTLFLLAAASHLIAKKLKKSHSLEAAKALDEFEKKAILEESANQSNAPQIYESGSQFPIGAEPLLVMDISCSLTQNGERIDGAQSNHGDKVDDAISVDFLLPAGANLNLKLASYTLQAMCVLLDQLRGQAGWGDPILQIKNPESEEQNQDKKMEKKISIH